MIFFDSHAHLCDEAFDEDREEVIQKCFDADVKFITEIGYSEETSRKAVELANKYELTFLDIDFKKENGFLKTMQIAKAENFYRQSYCGCEFSIFTNP